jgi:hypothetical protein
MNELARQYQTRVLSASEGVDYASIIKSTYPPEQLRCEPVVGFKALCTDRQAYAGNARDRLAFLDTQVGYVVGPRGCIVRETNASKPDGLWVITIPTVRRFLGNQLTNLRETLDIFGNNYDIHSDKIFDVSVSGRCSPVETEQMFQQLIIPKNLEAALVPTNNIMCRLGYIQRINDEFVCLRTRWDFSRINANGTNASSIDNLAQIAQVIVSIFK